MLDDSKATTGFRTKLARGSLGRRGALGALAALVAATMGKVTEQPVQAADGDVVLGAANNSTSPTQITNSTPASTAIVGIANGGIGVSGKGGFYGVYGEAVGGGFGIFGFSPSGYGIIAQSTNAVGLFAVSSTQVGGYCQSTSNYGLFATSSSGEGVAGNSGSNIGVHASSSSGVALRSDGPTELYGNVEIGDFETVGSPLYNLNITGDLKVNGQKSAIVRGADGEFRQFYCQESPESYFEDFGTAKLDRGKTRVNLDDEFKYFVAPNRGFYVFLTPLADTPGLYVSNRDKDGFNVQEIGTKESSIEFQYRVVCTRKDVAGKRLERVDPSKREPGRRRVPRTEGKPPKLPPMPNVPRTTNRGEPVPQPPSLPVVP